jgi:hypothetical protein
MYFKYPHYVDTVGSLIRNTIHGITAFPVSVMAKINDVVVVPVVRIFFALVTQ